MENLFKFLWSLVAVSISGLCLALLWKWFVTPLGVPAISVVHAIGINFILTTVRGVSDPKKQIKFETITYSILFNLVGLFFGYLIHLVM